MRIPQSILGLVYLISGLWFAYNSAPPHSSSETRWGYALTGITCLIVGARFFGCPLNRHALTGMTGKPDPLE